MCHSRRKKKVREGKDVFITVSFVTIQVHGEQLQPINTQSLRIKVAKNAIDSKKETRPRRDSKSQSSDPKSDALFIRSRGANFLFNCYINMFCIKESSICDWRRKYILSIQLLHTTRRISRFANETTWIVLPTTCNMQQCNSSDFISSVSL